MLLFRLFVLSVTMYSLTTMAQVYPLPTVKWYFQNDEEFEDRFPPPPPAATLPPEMCTVSPKGLDQYTLVAFPDDPAALDGASPACMCLAFTNAPPKPGDYSSSPSPSPAIPLPSSDSRTRQVGIVQTLFVPDKGSSSQKKRYLYRPNATNQSTMVRAVPCSPPGNIAYRFVFSPNGGCNVTLLDLRLPISSVSLRGVGSLTRVGRTNTFVVNRSQGSLVLAQYYFTISMYDGSTVEDSVTGWSNSTIFGNVQLYTNFERTRWQAGQLSSSACRLPAP